MKFETSNADGGRFRLKATKDDYLRIQVSGVAEDDSKLETSIDLTKSEALAIAEWLIEHFTEDGVL